MKNPPPFHFKLKFKQNEQLKVKIETVLLFFAGKQEKKNNELLKQNNKLKN